MKQTLRKFALVVISMFVTVFAFAQVTSSSMSGKITDANGENVAGATVVAIHTPTGSQYYAITDAKGVYRIANMRAGGPYKVAVQMLGYHNTEITDINIALADNYVLNSILTEESMNLEEVIISAESKTSNMRSDRSGAMTTIDQSKITSLPTISRELSDLTKLTPQAFNSGNGPAIGGGTYRQNFFTIDGAASNNAFGIGETMPAGGSPVSMDALEQISVSVTPYDVRQSGFLGGSLNAVTRSGGNNFEASVYSYFYNQAFRGKKIGNNELTLNEEQHLLYGVRIGGPIVKDKLFFFASFEMEDDTNPGPSSVASTPENPYTTGKDGIARPSASTLDALSTYLKDKYEYSTGAYQGYSSKSPSWRLLARIDWNINKNHKFNVRYSNTHSKYPSSPSTSTSGLGDRNFTSKSRTAMTAMYYQNARYYQEQNFSTVAAELNSSFLDGKLHNTLRGTYSHQYEPRSTEGSTMPFVDVVVADNIYTSFGTELFSYGNLRDVNTINVTDEISANLGAHNLTGGVQYEWNRTKNGFQRFGAGYYTFLFDDEAALNTAISNGTVFNDPHQFAITHSMKSDFSQAFPQFDFHQVSVYAQDDMNLGDRFKLSLGLRVELPIYPSLSNNFSQQVADATLADYNGNGGKYDTTQLPSTKVMFSPRVGFNWDILGDRQLVLRGGSGLFTGRLPFVWIVAQAGDSGVLQATYTAVKGGSNTVPTFTKDRLDMLKQIYPNGVNASTASISSITLMANDLKMPQTWKSSLAMDYKLPGDVLFSLEGIYNYDINPVVITNVGLKDPVYSNINNYADNRWVWGSKYDSKLSNAYLLNNTDVHGYYYSITAKLEKNNWHGLSAMIAYTYSNGKSLGDGFGDQVYSAWQNAYTVNGQNMEELGYAGYIMPHRIIASVDYKIDYGKNFGTGISLFYEGGPRGRYSYTYTKNVVGDGGAYNLIYVPKSKDELKFSDYTPDKWEEVYTAEAQATDFWNFINNDKYLSTRKGKYAERNGLIAPWTHQIDVRVYQNFYINCRNGQRNIIQLGLDIRNLGNLISKNCGNFWSTNNTAILKLASNGYKGGSAGQDAAPVYQFQTNGTEVLTTQFTPSISTASTWMMQLSLRYIFK